MSSRKESTRSSTTSLADNNSTEGREDLREQVAQDIEAFLRAGGRVEKVERGERADPPRKPKSRYGSRPI